MNTQWEVSWWHETPWHEILRDARLILTDKQLREWLERPDVIEKRGAEK